MEPEKVPFLLRLQILVKSCGSIGWRISKNNDFVRRTEGIKPSSRTIGAESHERLGMNLC